jgi:chromate reductase, NAD(P)H dehydrogenase (quinone)
MKVLAISGSLRRDSYNTKLLRAAEELLPAEVDFELFEGLKAVPAYDQDDDVAPAPAAVAELREAIAEADAILFSTPEYNSSVPGALKNALDWVSRPPATNALRNTPVAVVGASTGAFGAVWSQAELRKILSAIGARVVDAEVAVGHAPTRFDEAGHLTDESLQEQLEETVEALLGEARQRELVALTAIRA